jgi:RNA polymerase sigma factor (sigma-70 family)
VDGDFRAQTAALRRGDEAAWREFHGAFYPRIFRRLLAVAHGDAEMAAEAAHLAFIRAVRRVPETGHPDELWRWLTVLARSAFIDEWRRRRSRGSLLRRWLDAAEPPEMSPPGSDPLALLDECLATLTADDRLLLEEKYFAQQPVRNLAAARDLAEKALESRLTRARERLRAALTQRLRHAD